MVNTEAREISRISKTRGEEEDESRWGDCARDARRHGASQTCRNGEEVKKKSHVVEHRLD